MRRRAFSLAASLGLLVASLLYSAICGGSSTTTVAR